MYAIECVLAAALILLPARSILPNASLGIKFASAASVFLPEIEISTRVNEGQEFPPQLAEKMAAMKWPIGAFWFTFLWPYLALQAKRFHDLNRPGWFALIPMVPYSWTLVEWPESELTTMLTAVLDWVSILLGLSLIVAVGFLKGTAGENQYGHDPLHGQKEE